MARLAFKGALVVGKCEGAYLERRREGSLKGNQGETLFYWVQDARDARGVCLMVHGLGEHSGRYAHVAEALTTAGFVTWGFDLKGHGRSSGARGHWSNFQELTGEVELLLSKIQAEQPDLPTILLGHSLGGLIVLSYALEYDRRLAAVVASSPALELSFKPPAFQLFLARTLGKVLPALPVQNQLDPKWLSRDPAVGAAYFSDPLVHRTITLGAYLSMRQTMEQVKNGAGRLSVPCLVLQAGEDHLVDSKTSRRFAEALQTAGSYYQEYDRFYHEIFNEADRQVVFNDLSAWLNARLN